CSDGIENQFHMDACARPLCKCRGESPRNLAAVEHVGLEVDGCPRRPDGGKHRWEYLITILENPNSISWNEPGGQHGTDGLFEFGTVNGCFGRQRVTRRDARCTACEEEDSERLEDW